MLQTLRAIDFRCWSSLSLDLSESGGIFVGDNAQGKTSILEATCVLLRLQSPRTHKLSNITRTQTRGFGVAAQINGSLRKVSHCDGSLVCEVDGQARPTSQEYLHDSGIVVWMGNDDLDLVRGGGELRRRYLDFIGSQWDPTYRQHWARYRRALKMKNLLLKDNTLDEKQIASWEEILIESGTVLADTRDAMLQLLEPAITAAHHAIGGSNEIVKLTYRRSGGADLRQALADARDRERRTRQATTGPHRDDIQLQINGLGAADFASEGQQRTLALALKLAQGNLLTNRRQQHPIYLIDDVFGELDPARRNALMVALPPSAQKWITTTHLDWWKEKDHYFSLPRFVVRHGTLQS